MSFHVVAKVILTLQKLFSFWGTPSPYQGSIDKQCFKMKIQNVYGKGYAIGSVSISWTHRTLLNPQLHCSYSPRQWHGRINMDWPIVGYLMVDRSQMHTRR